MAEREKDDAKQGGQGDAGKGSERGAAKKPAKAKPRASRAKPKEGAAEAKSKESGAAAAKPASRRPRKPASEAKPASKRPAARKPAAAKQDDAETKAPAKPATRRRTAAAPRAESSRPALQRPVVHARAKYIRGSARKARLVMDHVRGKSVDEARAVLRHSPRGAARDVERVLESAIANAENNHDLVGDDLYVKEIYADEGPTLKRYRARAQGRVYRIRKRTSHLTVALTPKE
jgi:ribosomal protein L22